MIRIVDSKWTIRATAGIQTSAAQSATESTGAAAGRTSARKSTAGLPGWHLMFYLRMKTSAGQPTMVSATATSSLKSSSPSTAVEPTTTSKATASAHSAAASKPAR